MSYRNTSLLGLSIAAFVAIPASAASTPVDGTITKIGCHNLAANNPVARVCFIEWEASAGVPVTLPATLPSTCRSSAEVRWDIGDTATGQQDLNLLTAAFLAGKKVRLGLVSDTCFNRDSSKPTFEYLYVLH